MNREIFNRAADTSVVIMYDVYMDVDSDTDIDTDSDSLSLGLSNGGSSVDQLGPFEVGKHAEFRESPNLTSAGFDLVEVP